MAKDDEEILSHRGPGKDLTKADLEKLRNEAGRKTQSPAGKPERDSANPAREPRRPGTPKL